MLRALGEERKKRGLSQEELAARIGMQLEVRLIPAQAEETPPEDAPGSAEGSTTSAIAG